MRDPGLGRVLRLFALIATIFLITRALLRMLPGDPLETLIAETGSTLPREVLREELGLDRGYWSSVLHDIQNGLGFSITSREPVLESLVARLGRTLLLSSSALALALLAALPGAMVSAFGDPDRWTARLTRGLARLGLTLPSTWMGPVLLYLFAVLFPWAEFKGSGPLACLTLSIPLAAQWQRLISLRLKEESRQPFFVTAMGKGLGNRAVILKHALAPAGGALLAILGSQWGALLGGTFVVEHIFDWPGLGTAWIQAVQQRDYPMVEGATFIGATTCLVGMALGDWVQRRWDPRVGEQPGEQR